MKKYFSIFVTIAFMASCSDFGDMNVDPKSATDVPAETLFANGTKNMVDLMASTSVNRNIFRLFAQLWTETTYTDETNYDLVTRDQPGWHFDVTYRDVLRDLQESRLVLTDTEDGTSAAVRNNQFASISIMEVFAYHVLVDTFGDVPFTEALDIDNVLPAYDDDAAIYNAIIDQLDQAIGMISTGEGSFGTSDLIYGGDMAKWKKFANSIKLRMAVRISSVDAAKATTRASQAIASGVFTSNADNAAFDYLAAAPNNNPVYQSLVESGRQDFVPANTFVDIVNDLEDPRRSVYFDDNLAPDPYKGGTYGQTAPYNAHTHLGDIFHQPDVPGILMDYAEVEFLMAEAAELGLAGSSADAEAHYNNAITASFDFWGVDGAAAYLAKPEVAYATAGATWQESLAVQKWIHLFNRGFEAWTTYRIYGFPEMNPAPIAMEPVPRRYTYPVDETSRNGASYAAAASAMGGDEKSSRVFWDN